MNKLKEKMHLPKPWENRKSVIIIVTWILLIKSQVKRYISKYILDYRITVKGKTQYQLIDDLYTEIDNMKKRHEFVVMNQLKVSHHRIVWWGIFCLLS